MNESDFRFPTGNELWGDYSAQYGYGSDILNIIKKCDNCRQALETDFAILTNNSNDFDKNRFGRYWTMEGKDNSVFKSAICENDGRYYPYVDLNDDFIGTRPIIKYSSITKYCKNINMNANGIIEISCGYYPQWITKNSNNLELQLNNLNTCTEKSYTLPKDQSSTVVYKMGNKYFIRCIGNENSFKKELSDGSKVELGKAYWIPIEPIIWLIDPEKELALSKYILFTGLNYQDSLKFMHSVFSKEIFNESNQPSKKSTEFTIPTIKNQYNLIEAEVIALKLKNNYSIEMISKILNISEEDVSSIINQTLSDFNYNINTILSITMKVIQDVNLQKKLEIVKSAINEQAIDKDDSVKKKTLKNKKISFLFKH